MNDTASKICSYVSGEGTVVAGTAAAWNLVRLIGAPVKHQQSIHRQYSGPNWAWHNTRDDVLNSSFVSKLISFQNQIARRLSLPILASDTVGTPSKYRTFLTKSAAYTVLFTALTYGGVKLTQWFARQGEK